MITWIQYLSVDNTGNRHKVGFCSNADTKPTDVANGSILIEIDSGTIYCFDKSSETWKEWGE